MLKYRKLLLISILFSSFGVANADTGISSAFTLGAWGGKFTQSGFSKETSFRITPAIGAQVQLRGQFGMFFVEYTPTWFFVQKFGSNDDKTNDSTYWSIASGDFGISIPAVPIDVFVGGGWNSYEFSAGSRNGYSGPSIKAGAGLRLADDSFRIRFEYHKHLISKDDVGRFIDGLTTRAEIMYLAVGFGYSVQ